MKPQKSDYVLSFWVQGVSVFVTDIHVDVYKDLEVLFLIDEGLFKQYFTKRAYERRLDEGVAFYSDANAFSKYREALLKHCEDFKIFFEQDIEGKETLPKETPQKFFEYTITLCRDYTKMNSEFTDKAFKEAVINPMIKNNLAGVGQLKATIRSFMNMVLFEASGYSAKVFQILGKQFGLDASVFGNLTQQEILDVYENKLPDTNTISQRQTAFVINFDRSQKHEGKQAEDCILQFRDDTEERQSVTGVAASLGKAKGKVKIINVDYTDMAALSEEIDKMDQGDILVAETTAPELIIACRKAAAIVTDVGGLLSHAAIVSREFGIPCVVGTQCATKVFKDGDIVEVDAEKGLVRKFSFLS